MAGAGSAAADAAMERYAAGDESAFAEVYDALAPRLYRYLLRQSREVPAAEDLLQQMFLQMHRSRGHFSRGSAVMPWAYAIARRLLIDRIRRGQLELRIAAERVSVAACSDEPAVNGILEARQLAERLAQELSRLPTAHRAAFELVRQEGLSHAEAAQVLGTTIAAVKMRAHRAYAALHAALGDRYPAARESWNDSPG